MCTSRKPTQEQCQATLFLSFSKRERYGFHVRRLYYSSPSKSARKRASKHLGENSDQNDFPPSAKSGLVEEVLSEMAKMPAMGKDSERIAMDKDTTSNFRFHDPSADSKQRIRCYQHKIMETSLLSLRITGLFVLFLGREPPWPLAPGVPALINPHTAS